MSTKGQTINDRINAAKYTLAGQALARCICKATTEELMRPKKKHLDYLAACTYESNVSMLQLSNMIIERANHSNWVVVYKSLITVHHLMSFGSERFLQYLASSNYSFQLCGFLDKIVTRGYAMSTFIRRYSNYINQKALSYRTLAVDLCKTQRGEDNILRTMPIERLLETLPIIQKQLDVLLDFGCTSSDLSNSIITASFTLLFHDLIRLFASYNDGIINLFEKYFDLNKKMCREAFEAYKKFLACTDRVADFLKVGESINLDRGEIPDFKRAPSSLLDALEQHLISLESNKKRGDRVVIDTKLATFPSFSANTSLDFTPPQMATMATEFDAQLSFAAEESVSDLKSNNLISETEQRQQKTEWPSPTSKVDNNGSSIDNSTNISTAGSEFTNSSSLFDSELTDNPEKKNLFDIQPPGYLDGSLLTPEPTLQCQIDPSIDPHTQQQLFQIKREQVANKHKQSGSAGSFGNRPSSSTSNNNNNNYPSTNSSKVQSKAKQESIFEDLEQTMRQSLQKIEKA